ncbi:transposase [Limosilactobacillus reuteri]|nr:transposase [Limosilactobacillus reuteri]
MSRAGYYRWLNRKKSPKQLLDKQLMALIKSIYNERKGKWGYRRIKMELNNRLGKHYNVKRIRRLMSLLDQ